MDSTVPHDEEPKFFDSETAMGGADAVEKTSYVVGEGTDPNAIHTGPVAPVGRTGTSPFVWIIVGIAVVVALVYVLALFR